MKLRREVVDFIRQHREDFEPFVDEDVTFDRHLELLEQDGTYAGQSKIYLEQSFSNIGIVSVVWYKYFEQEKFRFCKTICKSDVTSSHM